MRIGLSGGGTTADRIVQQAVEAEADGFTSLWYAECGPRRPAGRHGHGGPATNDHRARHLRAADLHLSPRAASEPGGVDRRGDGPPGFTLGLGPSHQPVIEDAYGLSYDDVGAHTEEYVTVLSALLRGEGVDSDGEHFRVHIPVTSRCRSP